MTLHCHLQNSTRFLTTLSNDPLFPFITPRHEPRRKLSLSIVVRVGSRGNVFTESLPGNGSVRRNMTEIAPIVQLTSTLSYSALPFDASRTAANGLMRSDVRE
jgi:hypothetical protein